MASASSSRPVYPMLHYASQYQSGGGSDPPRRPNGNGNNNNGHARDAAENLFMLCKRCGQVLHGGNCRCRHCDGVGHINQPCPMPFLRLLDEGVARLQDMLPSRHIIQDEVNSWYGEVTNIDARLPGLREALRNRTDDIMQEVDRLSTELIQLLRDAPHAALVRERAFHLYGLGQVQQPTTNPGGYPVPFPVTAHPLNVMPAGPVNGFNQQPPPSSSRHGLPPPSGMDDISPQQHGRQHTLGKRKAEDEDDGDNGAKRRRRS
ncbi:hypothetical protein DBV05_g117 [Lasiodiplodia theobromae]|uniref:Uncharacterized protein n=1 Tax=Lasiodiplodia theobromae TaxID=45133 RepID=A0A5N5DZD8_9PEZI|nr:hypothetical protein DBV05_g117 [Lasiodiplodia theobromae]